MRFPGEELDGNEALHGNHGLDIMLQAPGLPVEARTLADVEIRNLYVPFSIVIFARDETGEGRFTGAAFLAADSNDCAHAIGYSESTKERKNDFVFRELYPLSQTLPIGGISFLAQISVQLGIRSKPSNQLCLRLMWRSHLFPLKSQPVASVQCLSDSLTSSPIRVTQKAVANTHNRTTNVKGRSIAINNVDAGRFRHNGRVQVSSNEGFLGSKHNPPDRRLSTIEAHSGLKLSYHDPTSD